MKVLSLCRCLGVFVSVFGVSGRMAAQEIARMAQDSLSVSLSVPAELPVPAAGGGCNEGLFLERSALDISVDTSSVIPPVSFPALRMDGTIGYFPDYYYGAGLWDLHSGFNASLSMSVSASFGKNRYPGVGFGTCISAMYAHQLSERLTLAAGGFYDRMSWGRIDDNRVGVNLLFGYQLTEKVSLYAYGSKVFTPVRSGMRPILSMPWMDRYRDRFGGMIHVKVNEALSFSVSVEERRM